MRVAEYPHPVLQPGGNDYRDGCSFDVVFDEAKQRIEENEIVLDIGYKLECPGIEKMIDEADAEVCVIAHSPAASYRRMHAIKAGKTTVEIRVGKFDVVEKLELRCVVVSACDSPRFELADFNPLFFESTGFKIKKGSILALTDKVTLYLDDTDFEKPVESIFRINRRNEQVAQIQPDFTSDTGKIEINLCSELYELYNSIEQGYAKTFRRCLTGAVVLPVLVEAIDAFSEDYEFYHEYRWARVVERKLEHLGIDIQQHDESSVELADMLLGSVIGGSLDAFTAVIEEQSEWEDSPGGVD